MDARIQNKYSGSVQCIILVLLLTSTMLVMELLEDTKVVSYRQHSPVTDYFSYTDRTHCLVLLKEILIFTFS